MSKELTDAEHTERSVLRWNQYAEELREKATTGRYTTSKATVSAKTPKNVEKGREKPWDGLFSTGLKEKLPIKPSHPYPYDIVKEEPEEEPMPPAEEEPVREYSASLPKDDPNTHFRKKKQKERVKDILDQIPTVLSHNDLPQWGELDDDLEDVDIYDDMEDDEDVF